MEGDDDDIGAVSEQSRGAGLAGGVLTRSTYWNGGRRSRDHPVALGVTDGGGWCTGWQWWLAEVTTVVWWCGGGSYGRSSGQRGSRAGCSEWRGHVAVLRLRLNANVLRLRMKTEWKYPEPNHIIFCI
jgi:hypothetical protein